MNSPMTATLPQVQPIHRDLHFKLPADKAASWHPGGAHISHFFNALSIFFPSGERFFIQSVRHYRDKNAIQSPELLKAVNAFIAQEAMHGREHIEYNHLLQAAGLPAERYEQQVIGLLRFVKRWTTHSQQLATTVALEHFTAIMADGLLRDPRLLEGTDPAFRALWTWHALEETEHKAVAYDVYQIVRGKGLRGYAERCVAMLLATVVFWSLVFPYYFQLVRRDGGLWDWRGWGRALNFQWGRVGALRKLAFPWLDYFRPGFHPWQHDNRDFLAQTEALAVQYPAA